MRQIWLFSRYRHFLGNHYIPIMVAKDSETNEDMVIYILEGGAQSWVMPVKEFLGPVDKERYPDIRQHMLFELEAYS